MNIGLVKFYPHNYSFLNRGKISCSFYILRGKIKIISEIINNKNIIKGL